MSRTKYSKELLEKLAKESYSIAQIIRKLGLREGGGTHSHISRKLKFLEIDTSHFLGQGANCGENHKGGPRLRYFEILINREKEIAPRLRQSAFRLRRALLESGRNYVCEECGQKPTWNGKELRLQVDHKNGNWLDDRAENLRLLCPNCHTQTPGFSGSKGKTKLTTTNWYPRVKKPRVKTKKQNYCRDCNKNISYRRTRCKSCAGKQKPNKISWPGTQELITMLSNSSYLAVAKKLGVSDNAIRKRIRNHKV